MEAAMSSIGVPHEPGGKMEKDESWAAWPSAPLVERKADLETPVAGKGLNWLSWNGWES
jgi:hypothetical protein